MSVKVEAYVHLKHNEDLLCFQHATLRAIMQHQDISMELDDNYRSLCVDCKAEKEGQEKRG